MAKVVVVVEFPDVNLRKLEVETVSASGVATRPTAWDVLGLAWGGELDHMKHEVVVDVITD